MRALPDAAADPHRALEAFALPQRGVYLDCAAHAPPLRAALQAAHAALDTPPWERSHAQWESDVERLRALAGDVLFAGDGDGLACVPSAAHAIATAARNLPLSRGEAVLVLEGQFPSDLLAWQRRCLDAGARLVTVRRDRNGPWTDAVLAALHADPGIRIASLCHVHWHDGALLDLDTIAPALHACDCALVLDLSQSLGVLAADLHAWRPDFVTAVGYKWTLGAMGLAWLWAAPQWRERGVALQEHWIAREPAQVWQLGADAPSPPYRHGARRFDAGVVADPVRLAVAEAGLEQLRAWGLCAVQERLGQLTRLLDESLSVRGLQGWTQPHHAPHITALRVPPEAGERVDDALREAGILCTRRDDGRLRIAPHLHVAPEHMLQLADLLAAHA